MLEKIVPMIENSWFQRLRNLIVTLIFVFAFRCVVGATFLIGLIGLSVP